MQVVRTCGRTGSSLQPMSAAGMGVVASEAEVACEAGVALEAEAASKIEPASEIGADLAAGAASEAGPALEAGVAPEAEEAGEGVKVEPKDQSTSPITGVSFGSECGSKFMWCCMRESVQAAKTVY